VSFYTRTELIALLEVEEDLVRELEQEEIVFADDREADARMFSPRMLERARVASILIRDLGVNVEGAAIIVRMREEIADLHRELERLLARRHA
jgi:MerR family transcriptional regulator, heat shock protein HspR